MGYLGDLKWAFQIGAQLAPLTSRRSLYVAPAMPLKRRLAPNATFRLPVHLPDGRRHRFRVIDQTDLFVLRDVFDDEQYGEPRLHDPRVIIDAGAHIGASAAYFSSRYPTARIHAIEASPSTFARLEANTKHFQNVTAHHLALAATDGPVTFYEHPESWGSSLRGGEHAVTVEGVTLATLLTRLGVEQVDLLKLDIEGAEYAVLRDADLTPFAALVGELHSWLPESGFTDTEFLALLDSYDVTTDQSGRDYTFRAVRGVRNQRERRDSNPRPPA